MKRRPRPTRTPRTDTAPEADQTTSDRPRTPNTPDETTPPSPRQPQLVIAPSPANQTKSKIVVDNTPLHHPIISAKRVRSRQATTPQSNVPDSKTPPKSPNNKAKSLPHDPRQPLENQRYERLVSLIAEGHTQAAAYKIAISPKSSKRNAEARASIAVKRPDLASRLEYLRSIRKRPEIVPAPKPAASEPTDDAPTGDLLTLDEARQRITTAVRQAKGSTETTQALKLAQDILRLTDQRTDRIPDPCAIVAYVSQAAGRPHAEIARELGGLRWMIERVLTLSKAPPSEVIRTLNSIVRDRKGQHIGQHDSQSIGQEGLLLDGQSDNAERSATDEQPDAPGEVGAGGQATTALSV